MTNAIRLNLTRLIFTLIFIAAGLILIHPVLAQDATSSTTRKERTQQKIEARKERIESKVATVKEKLATREAALKAKLEKFKDKRKAEIADRINTNFNKINQKQAAQMLKHLDKMSGLLDKLEARVTAKTAVADARVKIGAAKTAVQTQSEKDYTLTVTSESKVKADAKALRDQLKTDLQTARKQVIEAKQSVGNAIRVAKSGKEATVSGQQ